MTHRTIPQQTTALALLALLLAYLPLHMLSWSEFPHDVDPYNFVMALTDYNIAEDRPHPPGYPAYVGLAKLMATVTGAAHAYQAVNLVLLMGASLALYAVCVHAGFAAYAVGAIALALTHPIVLAATVVPESYVSDLAFGCFILAAAYFGSLARHPAALPAAMFGVFLACGMFRAVTCVMLTPLAMATVAVMSQAHPQGLWRNHWKRRVLIVPLAAGLATLIAYGVTVHLAGGLETYRAAAARVMGGAFASRSIFGGAPLSGHLHSLMALAGWFAGIALLYPITYALLAKGRGLVARAGMLAVPRGSWLILAAWIAPAFGFYAVIYYLKPTYNNIYLMPLMLIATAFAASHLTQHARVFAGLIAATVLFQLGFFFGGTSGLPMPLYRLTHQYFEQRDALTRDIATAFTQKKAGDLVVWERSEALPPYLARLFIGEDRMAMYHAADGSTVWFHPRSAVEYPSPQALIDDMGERESAAWLADKDRLMIISDHSGALTISYKPLSVPPASLQGLEQQLRAMVPSAIQVAQPHPPRSPR